MASKIKQPGESPIPTPQQLEGDREKRSREQAGFDKVLEALALSNGPTAPRLPEQSLAAGSYFGGYQKGFSSRLGFRGVVSFGVLRQVAERSPVLSAIISTRLHQMGRMARITNRSKKGEVGLKVVHKRHAEKDFTVPKGFNDLCREVEQMIARPWRVYWNDGVVYKSVEPSLGSFLSKTTEDLLVCNRPVVELGLDPFRVPRAFGAIDGANVIPTFAAMKYLAGLTRDIPKDYETSNQSWRRALQLVSDRYQVNLDERTEYIYILQGRPTAGFRDDELQLAPMFPSSDVRTAGYPKSLTERALFIILAEIMAMTANSRYFEFGSMVDVILAMKGQYQDKHVMDLTQILKDNMSGVAGMHRVPLVALPGGAEDLNVVQVKQSHKDMLFDVYIQKLTNLACAVFRMHPSEINEAPRAGDNSGSLNQASQTKQISMATEEGFEMLLQHHKLEILDPIVERIDPNLCVEWEMGQNEQEQITVTQLYGAITTVNERRGMMGLEPLEGEEGEVIDNQFVQAAKQAAQMPPAGQPPGPGGGAPAPLDDDQDDEQAEEPKKPLTKGPADESLEQRIRRLASV